MKVRWFLVVLGAAGLGILAWVLPREHASAPAHVQPPSAPKPRVTSSTRAAKPVPRRSKTSEAASSADLKEAPHAKGEEIPDCVGIIDLDEGRGTVWGLVKSSGGRPLADAVVTLMHSAGEFSIFTDASGRFEFRSVPEGSVSVVCDYAPSDGVLASATQSGAVKGEETRSFELTIEAEGSAALVGRLVTDAGGLPKSVVRVDCENASYQATIPVGEDGTFTARGIPAGPARVRVLASEVVLADETLELSGTTSFDRHVRLAGRGKLDVQVVAPDGSPVAEADVALQAGSIRGHGTTDDRGSVSFEYLEAGEYVVYAKTGDATTRTTVRIPEKTHVQLKFEEPGQ